MPCSASGTALGVSGTVQCPECCCGATARGSLCESEQGAAAAPFLLTRSQALLVRFTFAMTGAATLALPSSP